jgi:hypothetical protein
MYLQVTGDGKKAARPARPMPAALNSAAARHTAAGYSSME